MRMLNDHEFADDIEKRQLLALARQEIEQLRRWYAIATDLFGRDDAAARERGLRIYHRIFTAQAAISVEGAKTPLEARGPDGWADVASNALAPYEATQHLIGSQVVTFEDATFGGSPMALQSGIAQMSSYLQAWHASPDRQLRLVLGTYHDTVRFEPEVGWQIERMVLEYVSEENRPLGDPS